MGHTASSLVSVRGTCSLAIRSVKYRHGRALASLPTAIDRVNRGHQQVNTSGCQGRRSKLTLLGATMPANGMDASDRRSTRPRGRFWALQDLDDDEPLPSEEDGESAGSQPAPSATLGDAFLCARDLRGAPRRRKGKDDRFRTLEERLRRSKAALSATATPYLPPFRYRQSAAAGASRSSSPPASLSSTADTECGADWFRIIGGKAVRIGASPDSSPVVSRRAGRGESWANDGLPAALFPSRSPVRPRQESGADIHLTGAFLVSIRTLGRCGPPGRPWSGGNQRAGNGDKEMDSHRPSSPLGETPAFPHLDHLFNHLWIAPARVPEQAPVAAATNPEESEMGDRFGGQGGGDRRGGGYGYGYQPFYQHQRPPPPNRSGPPPPPNRSGPLLPQQQYKRKEVPPASSSANTQAGNQQAVQGAVPSSSSGAQMVGGSTGSGAAASSSATGQVGAGGVDQSKVMCLKCRVKGHAAKNCTANVECINCGKLTHLSENCTWLKQRKPVASFVGFGAPGLGCFVAEHVKDVSADDKDTAVALVKIMDCESLNVSADRLKHGLGRTYPWKWEWKVSKLADGMFLVDFPSLARINEAAIYDCVPLRGTNLMINISQWDDGMHAAGKLSTVWVQARGIPKPLLHFQGICEAGSTIGHVIEVDMKSVKDLKMVRIKMGVVDHRLIPVMTRVTTPDLSYYNVRFKLEEVVEEGWREDANLLKTLVDMDNKRLDEIEAKEAKRHRINEGSTSETQDMGGTKPVQASESTKQALLQRELAMKHQEKVDAEILRQKVGNTSQKSKQVEPVIGDSVMEDADGLPHREEDRVQLSDDDGKNDGEEGYTDSQESFGTRLGIHATEDEIEENVDLVEEETLRYSGRLANKKNEDVPVLDRAKTLAAARNLDANAGEGGRKAGVTAGRKTVGKGR